MEAVPCSRLGSRIQAYRTRCLCSLVAMTVIVVCCSKYNNVFCLEVEKQYQAKCRFHLAFPNRWDLRYVTDIKDVSLF